MSSAATTTDGLDLESVKTARSRLAGRADRRTLLFGIVASGGFLAVAVTLAFVIPTARSPGVAAFAILIAAYAAAVRVRFELSWGGFVPTQLVFVPMLFVLPVGTVPLAVATGLVAGALVDALRGRMHLSQLHLRLEDAWYAVGPVLVLGFALDGPRAPSWSHLWIYVGALGAQFAFDYTSSALRAWFVMGLKPLAHARFAAQVHLVDASLAPVGLLAGFAVYETPQSVLLLLPLIGLLAYFSRERRARIDSALELSEAYRGTAMLLGDVVEADDEYTGSHSRDVVNLVLSVADRLGLDARERQHAEFVALLHDVGKIRIPGEIINKPGKLSPQEWAVMKTHTIEGERMLERVGGLLEEVGRIVRSCHERWDGDGYPDGLVGEQTPLVARIVCACDAFSAMTTNRPYRSAMSFEDAIVELRRCAGTQFDPVVVEALASAVDVDDARIAAA